MATNIDILATILNTLTTLTITKYPDYVPSNGYNLSNPEQNYPREAGVYMETYYLQILSESADNLKTAITAFLQADSRNGSYQQTNGTYPIYIKIEVGNKDIKNLTAYMKVECKWTV